MSELLDHEQIWQAVFDSMNITVEEGETAEMEFRKAFYKLKFDRAWNSEIQRIENEHYTIMGAILAFTKPTSSA